jgi:mono/diheme cytochrome c family protein
VKKGPAPLTSVGSGQQMYEAYCASCHGRSGKGDGPAAAALKTPPANLTTLAQRNGGKFPAAHVSEVIRNADVQAHCSSEMPVWGPVFRSMSEGHESDVRMRINNLAKYIESLQQK